MRKYEIRYLPSAQEDLFEILDYIKVDNPNAAIEFIKQIESEISKLASFPRMGVIPNDSQLQTSGYRMLVIDNYLVFYVVLNNVVEIRRVIHGKRRYSFLL